MKNVEKNEEWLSVKEAATALGYSAAKVYQMIYEGQLPRCQREKGGKIRIKKVDVEKEIENNYGMGGRDS
ncbi:MAG: helix-turn-helix domain-containing protein [Aminipila sp.]